MSVAPSRPAGNPGMKGGYLSASTSTWSTSDASRAMFTGPSQRYRSDSVSPNCWSRKCGERLRTLRRHLEAHGRAELALRQFALQRLAQVLHLDLVDPQVGVAGDAELRIAHDGAAREEFGDVRVDHRRQHHEGLLAAGDLGRHADDPRQHARRLDDGDARFASEGVVAGQLDDEIETLVDDLRERMRRIEPDRRQQRPHLLREVLRDPVAPPPA